MIFVTGGTGLVGSHLLMRLVERGIKPRALCRAESDLRLISELFEWYGPEIKQGINEIEWVTGDLNDLTTLETAMEGVTEVYHCAAHISFDPGDREILRKVNHEGTQNIVNLCLGKGIRRLYYCSSIASLGGINNPVSEEDQWDQNDTNVYATSKYLAEMEVWRGGQEGLETVIINPGVIFGPGFWHKGSGPLFTKVASGLKFSPPGGTGFVGVWDVVRAFEFLIDKECFNERYILVAENINFKDLLTRIAALLEVSAPSRRIHSWQLDWLWRLDWIRVLFSRSRRKITRDTARSLSNVKTYSSEKIIQKTGFRFEPINQVLNTCARHFNSQRGRA